MADLAERLAKLPQPALIFDEALTNAPHLLRYLPQDEPGTWFQTRVGMLGTGLPGTVGLKLAHPDRTVFGFAGDGSAISTIQTLATAARYGVGAKFVVCNNKGYRILKENLRQYWRNRHEPDDQAQPDSFDLAQPELRFRSPRAGPGRQGGARRAAGRHRARARSRACRRQTLPHRLGAEFEHLILRHPKGDDGCWSSRLSAS